MKMARKVLSVLLAVVMALSCFGVAVSAFGDADTADHHAAFIVKGAVGSAKFTSSRSITVNDPGEENAASKITAEAGDAVFVYVYATADYYMHTASGSIFYPAAFKDPNECLSSGSYSASNLKKAFHVNPIYEAAYGSGNMVLNYFSGMTAANKTKTNVDWPVDADGKVVAPFGNTAGEPDLNKWKFSRFSFTVCDGSDGFEQDFDGEMIPGFGIQPTEADGSLLTMCLMIPEGTPDGTYTICMAEGTTRCADKPEGNNFIWEMGTSDSGELDGYICYDSVGKTNFQYNGDGTGYSQFLDYSQATLTIQIGEEATELDYDELDAAIEDFEALTEADWTAESWAVAEAAYEDALDAKENAETQDDIDDAAAALNAAIEALEEPEIIEINVGDLMDAIAEANSKDEADYTAASWADLEDALEDAQAALSADTQEEVDTATDNLLAAIEALEVAADTSALEDAVAAALAANEDDYDEADWSELQGYVEDAEDNYIGKDLAAADAQSDIDNLAAAINALLENKLDKSALEAAIAAANEFKAEAYAANYTEDSWAAFNNALVAAEIAMGATSQAGINAAAAALTAAQAGLVEADAYYGYLNSYIESYEKLDESDYKAGWDAFAAALAAAKAVPTGLKAKDQATIDEAAMNLFDAAQYLEPWGAADTSALVEAIGRPVEYDAIYYTDESLAAYEAAVDAAFPMLSDHNLTEADQDDIDAAAAAVNAAYDGLTLKPADTEYLFKALDAAADIDPDLVVSTEDLDAAVAAAWKLLENDLTILDQDEVTGAANDITFAIDNLAWLTADYSSLNEAKEIVESLVPEFYVPELLEAVMTAYGTACDVEPGLGKADQWKVDAAAETLWAALDALEMLPADYTAVNAAITAANKVKETTKKSSTEIFNNYTDESWAAFATAKAAAEALDADRYIEYQGEIDAATTALTEAQANLVWAAFPYEALANPVLAEIAALDEAAYTPESWANLMAKVDALDEDLTMENFTKGMQQITAINTAKKNLVEAEIIPDDADYTELDAALRKFEALTQSDWTGDSWALAASAYDYAAGIDRDLTVDDQDIIDAATVALNEAIDNLVKYVEPAIKTALKAAIDRCDEIEDFSIYTDETVDAVIDAYRAAVALYEDETLTFDDQDAIDNAANVLGDAIDALELKPVEPELADYTELDKAIARVDGFDFEPYTQETIDAAHDAYLAAKDLARDLTADDQAIVDAAAKALNDAMDNLELKPTEPEEPAKGDVQKVEVKGEPVTAGEAQTYEVTVKDRAMMVQFIEAGHGDGTGTRTFDRYNDNVTITSYKADGTQCNSLDKDLAYEVWTITTPLAEGEVDVRVKANGETKYEDVDVALSFVNEYKALDSDVISATPAKTSGPKGGVKIAVVTGADVQTVQLKNDRGETFTFGTSKATDNGDGTLTFNCSVYFHGADGHTDVATIRVLDANGWHDSDVSVAYTIGTNLPK